MISLTISEISSTLERQLPWLKKMDIKSVQIKSVDIYKYYQILAREEIILDLLGLLKVKNEIINYIKMIKFNKGILKNVNINQAAMMKFYLNKSSDP